MLCRFCLLSVDERDDHKPGCPERHKGQQKRNTALRYFKKGLRDISSGRGPAENNKSYRLGFDSIDALQAPSSI